VGSAIGRSPQHRAGAFPNMVRRRLLACLKSATGTPAGGALGDLARTKAAPVAANAPLRQQPSGLRRMVERPTLTPAARLRPLLLARLARGWRSALLIVRPETPLRRHRQGFRLFWRRKSAPRARPSPLAAATITLIRAMGRDNPLWGAERIRGELLKLDIRVSKRTIQKYLRQVPRSRPNGQPWATFLRNHAGEIWACDFLPVTDALFRPVYAFFVIALGSRRVVHVGVTRHPTDAWVAQQLREATPFGERPRYLIRDNDSKFGRDFTRVAESSGITVLRTAYRAPRQNATCERFLGSVRRECLDHVLVLGEAHLRRILREYTAYFNTARPHQGLHQRCPHADTGHRMLRPELGWTVHAVPVLGGLHHTCQRAA
jgi:putative transposase